MVKVCTDVFPIGYCKYQKSDGFSMHPVLKEQIDFLLKNIKNDWDFTIVITGGGEVRVGKSVLAMQIGAYWTDQIEKLYGKELPWDVKTNFIFEGQELIKRGNELGTKYPYSALVFDEAGADLEGRKAMQTATQEVMDYMRECGQYNLLNILVMPEFFDLPKGLAISRSIFLIDVTYEADDKGIFQRGIFNFYSRPNKKMLYLKGKRELDYKAWKYDFQGTFDNFYTIDEKEYRQAKVEALKKRETKKRSKFQIQRDASWFLLTHEVGWSQEELGKRMEQLTGVFVPQQTISDAARHFALENE